MTAQALYRQKRTTATDAVRHVHNGDTIIVSTGVGEPPTLLTALSEQRHSFHDVKVAQILALRKYAFRPRNRGPRTPRCAVLRPRQPRGGAGGLGGLHAQLLL